MRTADHRLYNVERIRSSCSVQTEDYGAKARALVAFRHDHLLVKISAIICRQIGERAKPPVA